MTSSGVSVQADDIVKMKANEKKNRQILGSCQRAENSGEHEGDDDTYYS